MFVVCCRQHPHFGVCEAPDMFDRCCRNYQMAYNSVIALFQRVVRRTAKIDMSYVASQLRPWYDVNPHDCRCCHIRQLPTTTGACVLQATLILSISVLSNIEGAPLICLVAVNLRVRCSRFRRRRHALDI